MKTVAIVSGGLDSSVLAYYLKDRGDDLHLVSFDYGQRHWKELDSARKIAGRLEADHKVIDLLPLQSLLGGSALTDNRMEIPEGHYAAKNMAATVVPNRNAIMLSIAYGWAVSLQADRVAIGVHSGDHPIYSDCRPEFIKAFNEMEDLATAGYANPTLELEAPFLALTKAQIVDLGAKHGVPFQLTWSCYVGGELHCSKCGTCAERREAFKLAHVSDPTEYELSEEEFEAWWAMAKVNA